MQRFRVDLKTLMSFAPFCLFTACDSLIFRGALSQVNYPYFHGGNEEEILPCSSLSIYDTV